MQLSWTQTLVACSLSLALGISDGKPPSSNHKYSVFMHLTTNIVFGFVFNAVFAFFVISRWSRAQKIKEKMKIGHFAYICFIGIVTIAVPELLLALEASKLPRLLMCISFPVNVMIQKFTYRLVPGNERKTNKLILFLLISSIAIPLIPFTLEPLSFPLVPFLKVVCAQCLIGMSHAFMMQKLPEFHYSVVSMIETFSASIFSFLLCWSFDGMTNIVHQLRLTSGADFSYLAINGVTSIGGTSLGILYLGGISPDVSLSFTGYTRAVLACAMRQIFRGGTQTYHFEQELCYLLGCGCIVVAAFFEFRSRILRQRKIVEDSGSDIVLTNEDLVDLELEAV